MDTENYRLACALRDRLLAELNENLTFKAFQHAQEIVNALARPEIQHAASLSQNRAASSAIVVRSHKSGSMSSTVSEVAAEFLQQKGSRASSGEIFEVLRAKGIDIPGTKPTAVVASYLSHSARFDNIRGQGGYGLAEWSQAQTETPNSEPLFGAPKTNGAEPLSP
jgi:hypothetical protein